MLLCFHQNGWPLRACLLIISPMKTRKLHVVFLTALLTTACSDSTTTSSATDAKAVQGANCDAGENLLGNPAFTVNTVGAAPPWQSSQHAGEKSFELSLDNGTATIEKIATQPWYTMSQSQKARPLRGKIIEYSAEIKLELDDEDLAHAFKPGGGLTLTLRGDPDPVMGGDRLLESKLFEHEPHLGTWDWTPVSMRLAVPENATNLKVGFAHQANGWMAVRNPALRVCNTE